MKILLTLFLLLSIFSSPLLARQKVISVLKSKDVIPYNDALKGVREELNEEEIKLWVIEYEIAKSEEVVDEIKTRNPDLILTFGLQATQLAMANFKKIPIVFSMVLDPEGEGLKAERLTGASLDIPVKTQFGELKAIIPKARKIGVIYNLKENEHIIERARQAAKDMGVILKEYPINSIKEIPKVEEMDIDTLWLIPDTMVCQRAVIRHILLSSLRKKIAVMGISSAYVKAGALMALSCDYEDIGRQSGEIAVKILKGESSSDTAATVPRKTKLSLNLTVADRLGINIPKKIIKEADEVFGKW